MASSHDLESKKFGRQQHLNTYSIIVVGFITISSAAYGYAGAIIATTLTQPSFNRAMNLDTSPNASSLIGAMNALYYAGGVFGSFLAGWTCDRLGRKPSVAMGNLVVLISGALLTASVNPAMFIVFRFLSGFGSFQILSSVPMWVAELAPPKIRGIMVDVHAVLMMVGYTSASYVGLGFYFVSGKNQWRGPIGLTMALPFIILCGIYWMPESPRYLLAKGHKQKAWKIVHRLHSSPHDPEDEFARREFYQMRQQIEHDITLSTSYLDLFIKPSLRKRTLITIFLEFCLMSSGILVVLNNGSIIWRSMGFNTVQVLNFQAGFQLCGFVFNIIAMSYVDRVKRNVLITVGLVGCATTIAVEAALQKYYLYTTDRRGLIAAATMIFVFQATYSLFLDGATYFYIAEIWPSHLRSQGYAIGIATLSLTNLVWLQGAPHAFDTIGWKYYLFFVVIPVLGAIVIFFVFPDTLHKPLEEIAAMFGDEDMVVVYQRDLDGAKIMEDPLGELDIRKPPEGNNGSGYLTVAETSNSKECSQEIELTVDA